MPGFDEVACLALQHQPVPKAAGIGLRKKARIAVTGARICASSSPWVIPTARVAHLLDERQPVRVLGSVEPSQAVDQVFLAFCPKADRKLSTHLPLFNYRPSGMWLSECWMDKIPWH
jgi:hypothetical protein